MLSQVVKERFLIRSNKINDIQLKYIVLIFISTYCWLISYLFFKVLMETIICLDFARLFSSVSELNRADMI